MNAFGPPADFAISSASRRVGPIRLSRIAARCDSVKRPAIDAPAR